MIGGREGRRNIGRDIVGKGMGGIDILNRDDGREGGSNVEGEYSSRM